MTTPPSRPTEQQTDGLEASCYRTRPAPVGLTIGRYKPLMSMINEIAAYSTAMSAARTQTAVATKVLKMANNQAGEVVSRLLDSAMENMQAIMQSFAGELGNNIDETA